MATLPLLKHIPLEKVESLASRSNLRFGKQILKDGKIAEKSRNAFRCIATVEYKNGAVQTAELLADHKGLHYKCTCTNRKNIFCEHCTAVALSLII